MRFRLTFSLVIIGLLVPTFAASSSSAGELRVGAAVVDVTPEQLPVLVNGGMTARSETQIKTRINARAIVLDDGAERIGIVVVDSCMMPRELLDEAKQLASTRTQLKPDRILISATHTHTAPSSMGALGTPADPSYVPFLRQKLVEALVAAEAKLTPARVGWGSGSAPEFTALRRWIRRPDRIDLDPFGNPTVRANMHAASNPDNVIGPSGPEDPELSMIAFQSLDGRPLAVLANFSMHYFGDAAISSDYFGLFCDGLQRHLSQGTDGTAGTEVVAIMSHGCSGDIWRRDYMLPTPPQASIEEYSQGLLSIATEIYDRIETIPNASLAMLETQLPLRYRTPDKQLLQWAQQIVQTMGDRLPQSQEEIYAQEQVTLDELQETVVVLQAIRIGDMTIATTPNETYALTGLKLKHQSPFSKTMVIELANGGDGYIPPPEQHALGGYNTWAARSAGLEVMAEPKIVAANLRLLEQVCERPRREIRQSIGPAAEQLLESKPRHYWRLDETANTGAMDQIAGMTNAEYETGVVFFLEGPDQYTVGSETNRCAHFAGGRVKTRIRGLNGDFCVDMNIWNGMPVEGREVTGWFFSRDAEWTTTELGLHVGLGGTSAGTGKLIAQVGQTAIASGTTELERWKWYRVQIEVSDGRLRVYLDDPATPEIEVAVPQHSGHLPMETFFFGGRSDNHSNWEGRLDEIALFALPGGG